MVVVSGLVGDADGEQGEECGDAVEARVRGFRQQAEGAGEDSDDQLEQRHARRGQQGEKGYRTLF